MRPQEFFAQRSVFRLDEFRAALLTSGRRSPATIGAILKQHVRSGRLLNVRRGLYAVVPPTADAATYRVDPFLVASRLTRDAIIAYHAALELLGKSYSVSNRITYLTLLRMKPFRYQDHEFVPVLLPEPIQRRKDLGGGIREEHRQGMTVRVTGHERALVDVLDAPQHGGSWEEIWRSLESIEFVDLDFVVTYALRLGSALSIARVGFYLEQHRNELLVEERHLDALRKRAPVRPTYFDRRRRRGGAFQPRWNLFVPEEIRDRSWGEVA